MRSLYSGLPLPLATYTIVSSALFGTEANSRKYLKLEEPTYKNIAIGSAIGGFVTGNTKYNKNDIFQLQKTKLIGL